MATFIGSVGSSGTAGLAHAAIDQADTVVDAAERQPEHAAGLLAMMKPQPSRAERQRVAEEPVESADDNAAEPNDEAPSAGSSPALDMAPLAPQMAGMLERGVQAPMHRMPGEGALIRRLDRRRKRNC